MKTGTIILLGVGALLLIGMNNTGDANANPTPTPTPTDAHEQLVQQWIAKIKADPVWMTEIARKAADYGKSIEEELRYDAEWCIEQGWTL